LKHNGLDAVILDRDDRIGGVWARRYERLHLHTVRAFSGLAHYPIPRGYPKYVSKERFAQYLQDYVRHFGLNVVFNCAAHKVRPENTTPSASWLVESACGDWRCQVVVIAAGHFGAPKLPQWPGMQEFAGRLLHSVQYRTGREYAGQRVLVIGAGNSGAEIAADLAEQGASFVAVSIRTPPPIVPRDFLGTPAQVFGILMTPFPPRWADQVARFLARLALGDLSRYGLRSPGWLPFSAQRVPIIDVGFVRELKRGRIQLRPNVARFTPSGVVYDDGREEGFDTVIAATGFETGLAQLLDVPGVLDERGYPKYRSGQATAYAGLYFMGYTESVRGHLFEANRDSRRLADLVSDYLKGVVTPTRSPRPAPAAPPG
jgi:cation diffusion facilitator CzcD-associated flavoprotein CzcO